MLTSRISIFILGILFCFLLNADAQNDSIKSFRVDISINNKTSDYPLKKIAQKQLMNYSGDSLKLSDIISIKYLGTFSLKGLGASRIYKLKLSYSLPNIWHYSLALIVDSHHNGYMINLDLVELIKIKQNSVQFYFAGRYKNRYRYGYFKIFDFKDDIMYQIFKSTDPVSNYSFDCESYENDDLKLQNIDLNNDGYLDLKFSGIKNLYCKGLEQYGRDERKPIKKEKTTFIYYFNKKDLAWITSNK